VKKDQNLIKNLNKNKNELLKILKESHYGGQDKCIICSNNNEGYMVKNELWKNACSKLNVKEKSLICLKCLNKTMDRLFKEEDFIECPLNLGIFGFDKRWFIYFQKDYFKFY
jgi:hypothetical protein